MAPPHSPKLRSCTRPARRTAVSGKTTAPSQYVAVLQARARPPISRYPPTSTAAMTNTQLQPGRVSPATLEVLPEVQPVERDRERQTDREKEGGRESKKVGYSERQREREQEGGRGRETRSRRQHKLTALCQNKRKGCRVSRGQTAGGVAMLPDPSHTRWRRSAPATLHRPTASSTRRAADRRAFSLAEPCFRMMG